jgi:hypothetical protein
MNRTKLWYNKIVKLNFQKKNNRFFMMKWSKQTRNGLDALLSWLRSWGIPAAPILAAVAVMDIAII